MILRMLCWMGIIVSVLITAICFIFPESKIVISIGAGFLMIPIGLMFLAIVLCCVMVALLPVYIMYEIYIKLTGKRGY